MSSLDLPQASDAETERRVLYALLRPALRLARRAELPLKEAVHWIETAYYHELRREDMKSREAARLLDVSRRKVVQLSKQLKQNFLLEDLEVALPRKIEFMLWAGTATEGRIVQAFEEHEAAEVLAALEALVDQGRAQRHEGRPPSYSVPARNFRLYSDNLLSKLDGLGNLLDNLSNVVAHRFFGTQPAPSAFARTLNFRIRRQDLPELTKLYEEHIWARITELEARVGEDDEEVDALDLSIFWAPSDQDASPR